MKQINYYIYYMAQRYVGHASVAFQYLLENSC